MGAYKLLLSFKFSDPCSFMGAQEFWVRVELLGSQTNRAKNITGRPGTWVCVLASSKLVGSQRTAN